MFHCVLWVDLSRSNAALGARLSHLTFEGDRAFPAQCCVAAARIVKTVDVFKYGHFSRPLCLPSMAPDQVSFDGFEDRFDSRVIRAMSRTAHRCREPMLAQDFLTIVRTILAAANANPGSPQNIVSLRVSKYRGCHRPTSDLAGLP